MTLHDAIEILEKAGYKITRDQGGDLWFVELHGFRRGFSETQIKEVAEKVEAFLVNLISE